jgi:hypothetical protein
MSDETPPPPLPPSRPDVDNVGKTLIASGGWVAGTETRDE